MATPLKGNARHPGVLTPSMPGTFKLDIMFQNPKVEKQSLRI
jgi:hypothetical protein